MAPAQGWHANSWSVPNFVFSRDFFQCPTCCLPFYERSSSSLASAIRLQAKAKAKKQGFTPQGCSEVTIDNIIPKHSWHENLSTLFLRALLLAERQTRCSFLWIYLVVLIAMAQWARVVFLNAFQRFSTTMLLELESLGRHALLNGHIKITNS